MSLTHGRAFYNLTNHLIVAPIQQGFIDTDANYALITEADCYADYVSLRRKRKKPV